MVVPKSRKRSASSAVARLREGAWRHVPVSILLVATILVGATTPHFLTTRNAINILRQASPLGFMAMGMTIVLIGGGIDISVPAVMALSGILGAGHMANGGHPLVGVLIMVLVGTLLGSVNGMAVAYLRMVPFVVTLSMMAIATGTSVWLTRNVSVSGLPLGFIDTIVGSTAGIPHSVVFVALGALVLWIIMKRSLFGRWLYATGVNIRTAQVCGVPQKMTIFGTYAASGFLAGITAILVTARLESASPTMGEEGVVLNVMGAAVVGGASIYGGIGSPVGAVVGAIFITLISNSMNMLHIPYHTTLIVKGVVIIGFVAFDSLSRRRAAVRV